MTRKQKARGEQPSCSALADGDIAPVDLTSTDYARMADLVNLYKSLRWEPLMPRISLSPNRPGLTDVAALDRRRATVVRPSTRAFPRRRPTQLRTGSPACGLTALNLWVDPELGRIRAGQRQTPPCGQKRPGQQGSLKADLTCMLCVM